jgi:glycosyltransferase involved in cell wall biosynthesis
VESVAQHIDRLVGDNRLAERLGMAGFERVQQHFRIETMAEQYLDIYREAQT